MLKREVSRVHTRGLSLGARQLVQKHLSSPTRKSVRWQPVRSRGDAGRIPETNGFSNYWEHPRNPVPGPESRGRSSSQPAQRGIMAAARLGETPPWEPAIARARPLGAKAWSWKWIPAQKPIKRQGWWKRKFALFRRLATKDSCPKPDFLHWQPVGRSSFRQRQEKGATRKQQSHLGIGHQWSD